MRKNSNLVKAHQEHDYDLSMVSELERCARDPIYFIKTYVMIQHPTRGAINFDMYPFQEDMVNTIHNNLKMITTIGRQAGKLLTLSTPIPTPSGFVNMGDLKIGDKVLDQNGQPCNVVYVSDEQTVRGYTITFDDGTSIEACEDHQWEVHDRFVEKRHIERQTEKYKAERGGKGIKNNGHTGRVEPYVKTLTTKELAANYKRTNSQGYEEYKYYIPNTQPVQFESKTVRIDPYLLGLWLGDGTARSTDFTCHVDHKAFYESQSVAFGSDVSKDRRPNIFTQRMGNLNSHDLRHYKLLAQQSYRSGGPHTKHIPDDYMFNDVSTRIALLQGLMDTDGFIDKTHGTCHIQMTRKNPRLINDIQTLIESLGLKVTRKDFEPTNSTRLSFFCSRDKFDVFRIPHKLERMKETAQRPRDVYSRTIQSIAPIVDNIVGKCIQVDSERSLYLCSTHFVPTHNTTVLAAYALWYACFNDDKTILIVSNKNSNAMEFILRVRYAYEELPNWLKPGVDPQLWTKHELGFDNKTRIISEATTEGSGRGKSISFLICDELAFVNPRVVEEFWTSIAPTLSTGGKCAIISTPNGDMNKFAELWRGAQSDDDNVPGENGFVARFYDWHSVPGRDEAFKAREIASLGLLKWQQEYECVAGDTIVSVRDTVTGVVKDMTIAQLHALCEDNR